MQSLLDGLHIAYERKNNGRTIVAYFKEYDISLDSIIKNRAQFKSEYVEASPYILLRNITAQATYHPDKDEHVKRLTYVIARKRLLKKFFKTIRMTLDKYIIDLNKEIDNATAIRDFAVNSEAYYSVQDHRLSNLPKEE